MDRFNTDHYMKVRKERARLGLKLFENTEIDGHHLVGKKIKSEYSGEIGFVESVYKCWHEGYYISLMLNFSGSHAFVPYEKVTNEIGDMEEIINSFESDYKWEW